MRVECRYGDLDATLRAHTPAMAQAAMCVVSPTVSLERVRGVRPPNARRLCASAALLTKPTLPLPVSVVLFALI